MIFNGIFPSDTLPIFSHFAIYILDNQISRLYNIYHFYRYIFHYLLLFIIYIFLYASLLFYIYKHDWCFMSQGSRVLPGFGLSLGITIAYLSVIVLIPLSAVFLKSIDIGWTGLWEILTSERILKSLQLSFGASLLAAFINVIFGVLLAWCLVRYNFWGKRLVDALVDLPFALPTAVAGIALTALYAETGWIGQYLEPMGIKVAYTPIGITLALVFIGIPFVVRTVQPVLADLETELEEAAATLGATRWQTITQVILPSLFPAMLTGFALAFARGVGEYGSVIFIAGNMPYKTEIAPLMIISRLEEYDFAGATTIAVVMLLLSFSILFVINLLQAWIYRRSGKNAL